MKITVGNRTVEVTRLGQTNEVVAALHPGSSATVRAWLEFYRATATMYTEVAEVDRGHYHESKWWASNERDRLAAWQEVAKKRGESAVVRHLGGWPEGSAEYQKSFLTEKIVLPARPLPEVAIKGSVLDGKAAKPTKS